MKRSWRITPIGGVIVVAVIVLLLVRNSVDSRTQNVRALNEFLDLRTQLYLLVQQQLTQPRNGVTPVLPAAQFYSEPQPLLFPPDDHIRSTVKNNDWWYTSHAQYVVDLDESRFDPELQNHSLMMASTVLLQEIFGPLATLGFPMDIETGGSHTVTSHFQKTLGWWSPQGSKALQVTGSVIIEKATNQAIIECTIHEYFPRL